MKKYFSLEHTDWPDCDELPYPEEHRPTVREITGPTGDELGLYEKENIAANMVAENPCEVRR